MDLDCLKLITQAVMKLFKIWTAQALNKHLSVQSKLLKLIPSNQDGNKNEFTATKLTFFLFIFDTSTKWYKLMTCDEEQLTKKSCDINCVRHCH